MTETLTHGYSSESTERELSNGYPHDKYGFQSLHPWALAESSLRIGRVKIIYCLPQYSPGVLALARVLVYLYVCMAFFKIALLKSFNTKAFEANSSARVHVIYSVLDELSYKTNDMVRLVHTNIYLLKSHGQQFPSNQLKC